MTKAKKKVGRGVDDLVTSKIEIENGKQTRMTLVKSKEEEDKSLMPPPPLPPQCESGEEKKRKREELEEDTFVSAIDAIIRRDFFPDLAKLRKIDADAPRDEGEGEGGGPTAAPEMRLDEFLEKFEGEDNAAYEKLAEKERKRAARRNAWLKGTERANEAMRAAAAARPEASTLLITWPYEARNSLFYSPAPAQLTAAETEQTSSGRRPSLSHEATRFADGSTVSAAAAAAAAPTMRREEPTEKPKRYDLDGIRDSFGGGTHRFVATPSPAPGKSPFTTWGRIVGTPLPIEQAETPAGVAPVPTFKIPEPPKREKVGLALAEKASKRSKARPNTPMSPAARSLTARFSPSPASTVDSQLRASYSPALVKLEPGAAATPRPLPSAPSTPMTSCSAVPSRARVTDGLLDGFKKP